LNANSPDHAFRASGIYGQTIYVNPAKHVVIVQLSARSTPSGGGRGLPPAPFDAIADRLAQSKD
jgi:CubicO group peptidase (beta-lactamase class C family)